MCGAGWPARRQGPGPPSQRPPRLLPLAAEPRWPPVTLGALKPEPSRARAAAAAAARRSQAPSQSAGRGVGGGRPEGLGRARGAHWDWCRRPDPQPRGVSVGAWECAWGCAAQFSTPANPTPHLSRAPTSPTPPLAACGFLLLFVVWLGSFFFFLRGGGKGGNCSVCASGGGSQVRGCNAPPLPTHTHPRLRGVYRSPLGACGPVFSLVNVRSRRSFLEGLLPLQLSLSISLRPTLASLSTRYRSAAPQLWNTWRKEEVGAPCRPSGRAPDHVFTIYLPIRSCTSLLPSGRRLLN